MKTLLIAEDDHFLTNIYGKELEHEGLDIIIANDGEEAISALERKPPDLLLLDLMLPKVKGVDVLRHLRGKGWATAVIVLSNVSQQGDRDLCASLGIAKYFVKGETKLKQVKEEVDRILFGEGKS